MGYTQDGDVLSFPTNGDLSTKQKLAVVLNATGTLDVAGAAAPRILGVLIDDPKPGRNGTVQHRDVTKVIVGAAVAAGANLMTNASGQFITATAGNAIVAQALQAGAGAGSVIAARIGYLGLA
jgi:hypothetical protein